MKNYKLKSLSININNHLYLKADGFVFNEKNTHKSDLENAINAGFLEEVELDVKQLEKEAKAKADAEKKAADEAKAKNDARLAAKVKPEAEAKAKAEVKKEK